MNETLVKARKDQKLTITEAANQIGISHGMLAMLETRNRSGSDDTKIKVAKFYNMSIEDLFYNY
jgi:putative transcriptional regulator